jgi:hypothetical protein
VRPLILGPLTSTPPSNLQQKSIHFNSFSFLKIEMGKREKGRCTWKHLVAAETHFDVRISQREGLEDLRSFFDVRAVGIFHLIVFDSFQHRNERNAQTFQQILLQEQVEVFVLWRGRLSCSFFFFFFFRPSEKKKKKNVFVSFVLLGIGV